MTSGSLLVVELRASNALTESAASSDPVSLDEIVRQASRHKTASEPMRLAPRPPRGRASHAQERRSHSFALTAGHMQHTIHDVALQRRNLETQPTSAASSMPDIATVSACFMPAPAAPSCCSVRPRRAPERHLDK